VGRRRTARWFSGWLQVAEGRSGPQPRKGEGSRGQVSSGLASVSQSDQLPEASTNRALLRTARGEIVDATALVKGVEEHVDRRVLQIVSHTGPMPPPEQLREYESVLPGLADRIVQMAEREQNQRHAMQRATILGSQEITKRGQQYGLAVAVIVLVVAMILVLTGHDKAGMVLASVDLVSLVAVFVVGRVASSREEERRNKDASSDDGSD
jgi:uncharacterized membrane protein